MGVPTAIKIGGPELFRVACDQAATVQRIVRCGHDPLNRIPDHTHGEEKI